MSLYAICDKTCQNQGNKRRRGHAAGSRHLLCGDPPSFSQRLLTVDVDWIDADEPETHTD